MVHKTPHKKLKSLRRFTWLTLVWEQALATFWHTNYWVLFFVALWLLHIPAMFGPIGNGSALLIFLTGLIYLLRQNIKSFSWPDRQMVDRRLEQDSELVHRPLTHIDDRLANPSKKTTHSLWHQSKTRAWDTIKKLRLPIPRPVLVAQDPIALRAFVLLFCLIGAVTAGPQWKDRLAFGLFPFSVHWEDQVSDNLVFWITPPEYTALPQITLQGTGTLDDIIDVPAGSTIKMRVRGGIGQPVLLMGGTETPLQKLDEQNWGLELDSLPAKTIQIKQFFLTRAEIPIRYIEDQPPTITLTGEPGTLAKGSLQFPLSVQDDYGVEEITLSLSLDPSVTDAPLGGLYQESRAIMSPPGTSTDIQPIYELSWHSWAGLPVIIDIKIRDHVGQTGALPPLHLTLPERPFYNPVAQALIEQRKRLTWTPIAAMPNVSYELETILGTPEAYNHDIITTLSLRSMASRIHMDPSNKTVYAVIPQLWDTALHLEDGNLSMAARDLRNAQQELAELLQNPNATDEQIAIAMENLRAAMSEYFQELFQELQKQIAQNGQQPMIAPEMLGNAMNADDLAAFLDQLQSKALAGDRNAAQQLLSQLQQMMDGLNASMGMEMPPEMSFMMEGVNKLKELIENQQALLDRTLEKTAKANGKTTRTYPDFLPFEKKLFEQWGSGKMPPPPQKTDRPAPPRVTINTAEQKKEQDALRYTLGELMLEADEKLGKIPENMQKAEQEMRLSADELGENKPDLSAPHQEKAIDHLQEALQSMNQQLMTMMQQMTMLSFGMGPLDPLGRPLSHGDGPSMMPGSKVKVPDKAERKRVREILKILRQRSGEFNRPDYELEYYRRLMRQF